MDENLPPENLPPTPADSTDVPWDPKDEPVPFALTVRARRAVAPEQLPDLRLLDGPDDGALDRAGDPRPAQARALRRSGLTTEAVAARLGVDELVARAWVTDTRAATGPLRGPFPDSRGVTAPTQDVRDGQARPVGPGDGKDRVSRQERGLGRGLARAEAHRDALDRLEKDPRFAATVGFLAGMVEVEPTGLSCVTSRQRTASRLLGRLREEFDLPPHLVRAVLRIAPGVAGDLARHAWSRALDLPLERMVHTRWRGAGSPDAVEVMLRIGDEDIAATVAGWLDAFFDPDAVALELAF